MEKRQQQYITKHLNCLVPDTNCNTTLMTSLIAKGVLGKADSAHLDSIPNGMTKSYELYKLVMTKNDAFPHLKGALKESVNTGALATLNKYSEDNESSLDSDNACGCSSFTEEEKAIRFDVLPHVQFFTGRIKELENLHEKLQRSETKTAVVSQMASIVGLGGIGKTELARRYIEKFSIEYGNNVIWISAQTENTLKDSFQRLATDHLKLSSFNVDGKEKAITTLVDEVYDYFKGKKCLFVFDNAESNEDLQTFMPFRVAYRPYLLITSRDREWVFSSEFIHLFELTQEEAIQFVKNGLKFEQNEDQSVIHLVKTLQCFPLALSQAISHIKQQQMIVPFSISQYLKRFETCSKKLLNSSIPRTEFNTYLYTTLTTWKMTTDLISSIEDGGSEAIRILNIISYFEPDKIPTKLFVSTDTGDLDALYLLIKYSMVNSQKTEQTVSIHRLVQEVTRIELKQTKNEEEALKNALKLLSENIELDTISHIYSAYSYISGFPRLVVDFKNIPWRILEILQLKYSRHNVSYNGYNLKEILLKHVSSEDADLLRLERRIAWREYVVGHFDNSLKILTEIVPKYLQDDGNNFSDHEKLRVQNDMALTLKAMGKGWECLAIQEKILIEMMSLYGLEDWQTLETMIDVLNCLKTLGYYDNRVDSNVQNQHGLAIEPSKIISLVKVAHESKKELIGKDANWTTLMRLMATFLCDIEDYENARAISNDIYERTKNCSTYRGHATYCLNLMGRSKSEEGKVKDALEMYENAYQFFKTALGSNHLDTLRIRREMFMTLSNLDGADTDTVLEGLQDILEAIQMHHPNHEDATLTEIQIGITMIKMGKYSEGLKRIVKSKAKLQESYGLSAGTLTNINWWIKRAQRNMKT